MNIGFAFDINLVLPIINTMNSILENNNKHINFYVIIDNDKTENEIEKNCSIYLKNKYNNYTLYTKIMLQSDKIYFSLYDKRNHEKRNDIQTIHYAQLLFDKYFVHISKILYLEADQIITGSLLKLYNTDITNKGIYANPEIPIPPLIQKYINGQFTYFNCGVTLLNLDFWRQHNILNKCKNILEQNFKSDEPMYEYYTQGVLNLIFLDNFGQIENKYNYRPKYYKPHKIIYHWVGPTKPWNGKVICPDIYEKYDITKILVNEI